MAVPLSNQLVQQEVDLGNSSSNIFLQDSASTMATTEIVRGDFVYRDTLFVDVGEGRRHTRASVTELRDLLLPRSGINLPKDNVSHWYEAQLIHYGLGRCRDKSTAKLRLLQTISAGTLAVPQYITKMEAEMRKAFVLACRKAKSQVGTKENLEDNSSRGKKRKTNEIGQTAIKTADTTISFKVGDLELDIRQSASSQNSGVKKQRNSSVTVPKTKDLVRGHPPKSNTSLQKPSPLVKQAVGRSQPSTKKVTRVKPQHIQPSSPSLSNIEDTDAPPTYESHEFDRPNVNRKYQNAQSGVRSTRITGTYRIDIPYNSYQCLLELRVDQYHNVLWGRFDIGDRSGVIMSTGINPYTVSDRARFDWRSRHEETGSLRFGRGCDGVLEFDGYGNVSGEFFEINAGENIEFRGEYSDDDAPGSRSLEDEWHDFPRLAYGRE